jgi:NAD-dependent deacetylase
MESFFKRAARDLTDAKIIVALTGAGISVESGVPPFRGKGGVWEKFDPMEYAHIESFMKNPGKVWAVLLKEMKEIVDQAQPNFAHLGLAELEKLGKNITIITQNVDGLHQSAGSTDVIEFHGNFAWHYCLDCRRRYSSSQLDLATTPPRCRCGGTLRPECIFFGELIPPDLLFRSRQVSSRCDVMLVIGTSATVQPAAWMPVIAKDAGATVIEINPESTPFTNGTSDYLIQGKAGQIMLEIIAEMKRL